MALHNAVARQDLKEVETLLKIAHTNVNERDRTLQTPLHVACSLSSLAIVRELVNKNADVNATDTNNWTPLHCAASQSSDFDIILLLLDKPKINVTILSKDGTSMFHYLVRLIPKPEQISKYTLALKKSLEKGVDINLAGKHAESPLHQATNRKNIVAVNFLIENNAFIDPKNKFGETPLFYAVKAQFLPLIHLFLSNNADYTAQSKDGSLIDFANNEIKQIITEYSKRNLQNNIINEPNLVNNNVNVNQNPPQVNHLNINQNKMNHNNTPIASNPLPINNIMNNPVQPVMNYTPEQLMLLQQQQHLLMLQYTSAVQTQFGILPMNCVKCNEMFCYPALAVSIKCPNPNCRAVNEIDRSKQNPFPPSIPPLPYSGVPYSPVYYPNNPVYMNMPNNSNQSPHNIRKN